MGHSKVVHVYYHVTVNYFLGDEILVSVENTILLLMQMMMVILMVTSSGRLGNPIKIVTEQVLLLLLGTVPCV